MNCTHVQRAIRELWRLLEVYLFFVVSVLGCTGLGKVPSSSSSRGKDKSCERKIERRLPLQIKHSLIAPPKVVLCGFTSRTIEHLPRTSCAPESDQDEDISAAGHWVQHEISKAFSAQQQLPQSPFLSAFSFYHSNDLSLQLNSVYFSTLSTAHNLLQISTPLLT